MFKTTGWFKITMVFIYAFMLLCSYAPSHAEAGEIESSLYVKGVEYYHTGRLEEARDILEELIGIDPQNEEAQTYLDLINAEFRMLEKGKLDYNQAIAEEIIFYEPGELSGSSNVVPEMQGAGTRGTYSDNPKYDREGGYTGEDIDFKDEAGQGRPGCPGDRIKAVADALNDTLSPGRIRGEYKMAVGVSDEGLIWKDANGDYNERNFRMIARDFSRTNTFDKRVYDRFKVVFDTNEGGDGLNFHSDVTVDPWSFVGKTEKFTISGTPWGDAAEIELKYWSGNRSTINDTIYSSLLGNSFPLPEFKVRDGKTVPVSIAGTNTNEYGQTDTFTVPERDIDFIFQPIRELWFNYNQDDYKLRIFPFGLEDQALSSDDPLELSNHHTYWEPSPWLDDWIPGHFNSGAGAEDFWRGQWSNDLSSFTRDSDFKRLTALRGASFQGRLLYNTDLSMTVASPKTLWQDYESVRAIPGAIRTKTQINDELMLGFIDTFRFGYNDGNVDSYNNVLGADLSYDLDDITNIAAEFAVSESSDDKTSNYNLEKFKTKKNGSAAHLALERKTGFGDARIAFTHMDEGFDPGLANYKETRKDLHWSRHIHFKKPFSQFILESSTSAMSYDDIDPFRIGNGVDVGRGAFNFRLETKDAFDERMDNLLDYRHVRDANHKYVEGVFRDENTLKLNEEWTSKFLFIYHDLPKTKGGIDPISYDADTGEFLKNTAIEDGKDPSVSTYSLGVEYAPEEWVSFFGVYENTNDFRFSTGDHPNGLLNSTYFNTTTIGGRTYREEVPQLYSQGFFDLPPYERFNIYRMGVSLRPSEELGIDLDFTRNDFKFAAGIDDNMNHFGTTLAYKFNPRLVGFLKYTYSKAYNLFRLNTSGDLAYQDHHNVFMKFDYSVTEYGLLTIEFGEGAFLSPVTIATSSPFGDFLTTLDTQHIFRIYYHGKF